MANSCSERCWYTNSLYFEYGAEYGAECGTESGAK